MFEVSLTHTGTYISTSPIARIACVHACMGQAGSDKFVGRAAQTLNRPLKDKGSHCAGPAVRAVRSQAEAFAIADAFAEAEALAEAEAARADARAAAAIGGGAGGGGGGGKGGGNADGDGPLSVRLQVKGSVEAALAAPGCLLDADDAGALAAITHEVSGARSGERSG